MSSDSPTREAAPHFRALDGLRGIAILGVFYTHIKTIQMWIAPEGSPNFLRLTFARFGWVGVDLFFVLSGFLITGILLRARSATNYYSAFYARRLLRLAPLYYLAVILTFGAHWVWHAAPVYPFSTQIWYWLDLSNLPGAWELKQVPPLGPFWTLAIEEQFYLLWPWLVLRLRTKTLLACCVAMVPLEFILRCLPPILALNHRYNDAFSYRLTPLHSEGLFAGAATAILMANGTLRRSHIRWLRPLTGVLLLLAFLSIYRDVAPDVVRSVRYTSLSVAFAALIALIALQHGQGWLSKVLSAPILRMLGKYSYCIYVVHVPVIFFAMGRFYRFAPSPWALAAEYLITLLVCVAIGALSWRFIEGPILTRKKHFPFRVHQTAALRGTRTGLL